MAWISRLRGMLKIGKLEQDIEEELRAHVQMRTQDNILAGMTPEEARYDAQRRFGNSALLKEDTREADIIHWIEILGKNVQYAGRMLRRSPGFAMVAIMTLALGIGANVATFTVVRAVLLNPLPYLQPEQLVRVYDDLEGSNTHDVGLSVPELWDLRDKSGVFQDVSALWSVDANLTGGDHPERVELLATSPNYFTMLGARPQLGRVYTAQDEQPGFSEGVVLSDAFWRRTFGANRQVLGKQIRADGDLYTVIGVMPPEFRHPGRTLTNEVDVWAAAGYMAAPFPKPARRSTRLLPGAMCRLRPGLSVAQAQTQLNAFAAELSREFPDEYPVAARWTLRVVPLTEDLIGNLRTELLVLFGAVAFVLLIACVNLANLLLARSASRQREIAIRLALGAGRGRLIGQLLTESILLATISGGVALLTVVCLKNWFLRLVPTDLPRMNEVSLSAGVLLFAFGVSIVTGVIFGLVPALQTGRLDQAKDLREGSQGSGLSKHQTKISRTLVASEIAISLVLLIGAGLLLRSFRHLIEVRAGFEPHHVITAKIRMPLPNDPAKDNYHVIEKRVAFYQETLRRIRGLAGVEEAALGSPNSLPMNPARTQFPFTIENRPAESQRAPAAEVANVGPEYFHVLKSPLVRGRVFSDTDDSKSEPVVLVNETLARRYWSGQDPIGQHIQLNGLRNQTRTPWLTIVGIVGDIKSDGFVAESAPYIYAPMYQAPGYGAVAYLRTSGDPGTLGDVLRHEVQAVDPAIPVFGVQTMDEIVAKYLVERRFALELLGVFAGVALLLASIGIYGVTAYTFSQRANEIGIRLAMGAQQSDILKIAMREGASIVIYGVFSGLIGSLLLTRFLESMLFDVKPTDPLTFLTISTLLASATLLACFVPARRVTRVNLLIALRHE